MISNFPAPTERERHLYAQYWQKKLAITEELDFPDQLVQDVAILSDGFSFAYLKEVLLVSDPIPHVWENRHCYVISHALTTLSQHFGAVDNCKCRTIWRSSRSELFTSSCWADILSQETARNGSRCGHGFELDKGLNIRRRASRRETYEENPGRMNAA